MLGIYLIFNYFCHLLCRAIVVVQATLRIVRRGDERLKFWYVVTESDAVSANLTLAKTDGGKECVEIPMPPAGRVGCCDPVVVFTYKRRGRIYLLHVV